MTLFRPKVILHLDIPVNCKALDLPGLSSDQAVRLGQQAEKAGQPVESGRQGQGSKIAVRLRQNSPRKLWWLWHALVDRLLQKGVLPRVRPLSIPEAPVRERQRGFSRQSGASHWTRQLPAPAKTSVQMYESLLSVP
jgi:hypothetical protein